MAAKLIGDTVPTDCIEFDRKELKTALRSLCLTWAPVGDYLVIMNGEVDANICGEPYLALQLWLNLITGNYISRLWNQTIATGKVVSVAQFLVACKAFQGKPCTGCPVDIHSVERNDHINLYTPVPRRISQRCHKFIRKSQSETCPECTILKDTLVKKEVVMNENVILERKYGREMENASVGATYIKEDLSDNVLSHDMIETEALNTISELKKPYKSKVLSKKDDQKKVHKKCKCEWCDKEFTKRGLSYYYHVRRKHFWGIFLCPKCKKESYIFNEHEWTFVAVHPRIHLCTYLS